MDKEKQKERRKKIVKMMVERAATTVDGEQLCRDFQPSYTGFTPRRIERLATTRKPTSFLDVERRSVLRSAPVESVHSNDPVSYRLWLEAGKHPGPYPERPDDQYNSNVWRNFTKLHGFSASTEGRTVNDLIASMYPLNIPKPSLIGEYTFDRYIRQANLFENAKRRDMAIERSKTDISEFKRMRMLSDARNPPMDERGNILPPRNYKRYPLRQPAGPSEDVVVELVELPPNIRPDIFGRFRKIKEERPHRWKLEYKLNHPKPDKVNDDLQERDKSRGRFRPPVSYDRVPLWKR